MNNQGVLSDGQETDPDDAGGDIRSDVAEIETDGGGKNDGCRKEPTLGRSQMKKFRNAPVDKDVDENEQAIGNGD